MQITPVRTEEELHNFLALVGNVTLTPDSPSIQQADEHWLVRGADDSPIARCSLWYTSVPDHPQYTLGLIGHYAATDDEAAALLLESACDRLVAQNCNLAVGPMDGSTFRHYRFLTERAVDGVEQPPFFLEPDNPDAWPIQFQIAGFSTMANYSSSYAELPAEDSRLTPLEERAAAAGINVRQADMASFMTELERIYEIVVASFEDNYLYTRIDRQEFLTQYAQIQPYIRPEHVLIAEQGTDPVGFIFTLPDLAQQLRGESVDTLIVKTVAVLPQVAGHGLGSLLAARVQTGAYRLGLRYAIHALMHETNVSRSISRHYAAPMRRYALYQKEIAGT